MNSSEFVLFPRPTPKQYQRSKAFFAGLVVSFLLFSAGGAFYVYNDKTDYQVDEMDVMNQLATLRYYYDVCNHPEWHGGGHSTARQAEFEKWVRDDFKLDLSGVDDTPLMAWVEAVRAGTTPLEVKTIKKAVRK